MKKLNNTIKGWSFAALSSMVLLTACNKSLDVYDPLPTPVYPTPLSGTTIGRILASTPSDSLYNRMLIKSGLASNFNDSTKTFTLFVVDNAGMKLFINAASGGAVPLGAPDAVFSGFITNNLPAASAAGIISYNTLGQKYPFASFGSNFPNYPAPTLIQLDPVNTPFLRMTICPTNTSPVKYVNNIPIFGGLQTDQQASNGIIHHTFTVVAPPSATLRTLISGEPTLSYFRTALLRADSGTVVKPLNDSTNFLNYLLSYGVTNMTILTPNDAAFQSLIFNLVYSKVFAASGSVAIATANANGAVAAGPAFLLSNNLTTEQVKGIVAYHFLATNSTGSFTPNIRTFSVNVPSTPTFVKTLINSAISFHPGLQARSFYSVSPLPDSVKFTGYTLSPLLPTGTQVPTGAAAKVIAADKHAVNGIYHIIDKVLVPLAL
jgi:Fasciclin domain